MNKGQNSLRNIAIYTLLKLGNDILVLLKHLNKFDTVLIKITLFMIKITWFKDSLS